MTEVRSSLPILLAHGVITSPVTSTLTTRCIKAALVSTTVRSAPVTIVTLESRGAGTTCLTTSKLTVGELDVVVDTVTVGAATNLSTTVRALTVVGVVTGGVGTIGGTVVTSVVQAVVT